MAGRQYEDDFERFHDLEHWPGGLLLLLYTLVGAYAVYGFARIKPRHGIEVRVGGGVHFLLAGVADMSRPRWLRGSMMHLQGRRMITQLQVVGAAYLWVFPVAGLLASLVLPPLWRHPYARGSVTIACVFACVFVTGVREFTHVCLRFARVCIYLDCATLTDYHLNCITLIDVPVVCQVHHVRIIVGGRRRPGRALGLVHAAALCVFQVVVPRQNRG